MTVCVRAGTKRPYSAVCEDDVIHTRSALIAIALVMVPALGCSAPPSSSASSAGDSRLPGEPASSHVALAARNDAHSPEAIGLGDRLSVLSFNMEHHDRPPELAVMADRLRADFAETPDFILMQEVMFGRAKRSGEDNTAAVLANDLGYYCRGTQRSSDREGIAIASRYPFLYYASRELEHQTSRVLMGFNRVSVMGEFKVPDLGRVRVVNVHLTNWDFDARVRRLQLEETLEWVGQRQKDVPADLIIFGGDFNIKADSDDLDMMYDVALCGGVEYRGYNNPQATTRNNTKRVDYIFIATPGQRSDLAYLSEQTLFRDGLVHADGRRFRISDHTPVLQEYRVSTTVASKNAPAIAAAQ